MTHTMILSFINGAIMMATMVGALFFLKFWRGTADRFFAYLSFAFTLFSFERIAMLVSGGIDETRPEVYVIRCCAFVLIIWGVIEKNRQRE